MSSSMSSTSKGPSVGRVLVTVGMELVSQNGSNTLRSPPRANLQPNEDTQRPSYSDGRGEEPLYGGHGLVGCWAGQLGEGGGKRRVVASP